MNLACFLVCSEWETSHVSIGSDKLFHGVARHFPTAVHSIALPCRTALHPGTTVPLPAFMLLSALVLYLEMDSYGKWLFNQTRSLSRANPSYQLAVVGNFLVARLGTQVCAHCCDITLLTIL